MSPRGGQSSQDYGDEQYFGSGRMGFGGTDYGQNDPNEGYRSSWEASGYEGPDQDYPYGRRRYPNREPYGRGGHGMSRERGNYQSGASRGYSDSRYNESYGSRYPDSERGYMGDDRRGSDDRGWWERASDEVSSWFGDDEAERRRMMDERRSGNFTGRGPKNYTRSDDRIREDVNDRLTDNAYIDASEIDVQVNNGEVILSGTVESRYDKRMAEDITEDITGVKNVENRIRVNRETWSRTYDETSGHAFGGSNPSDESSASTSSQSTTSGTGRSRSAGR